MSILFDAVYRHECTSTHHKLAMDALKHLRGKQAEPWLHLFTRYYEDYLEGSKAPDKEFRDFRNHVLHVGDNFWGGVVKAANKWYDRAVESMVKQDYVEAVYCAGVLSHYYTDILMPFHTGQTEAEGKVHRAFEWSVCKSYDRILPLVETYPDIETPAGDNWLEQMIRKGAVAAHEHYDFFVREYDLERGRKRPQEGLNDELRERLAGLFGHAIVGTSRILERIFQDSQAKPPRVRIGLLGALTRLTSPFGKLSQYRASRADKKTVSRIYREWVRTGCVIDNLPADEREVRKIHAEEVLGVSEDELNRLTREAAAQRLESDASAAGTAKAEARAAKAEAKAAKNQARAAAKAEAKAEKKQQRAAEMPVKSADDPVDSKDDPDSGDYPPTVRITAASTGASSKPLTFHLDRQSPVVDAPSIGSKTARRLQKIGVKTVDDLLALNPQEASEELNSGYITPETLRQWQGEASLVCRIPNLRGHDSQMLVGCNMLDPQIIANMAPGELLDRVEEYLLSEEGERLLTRAKEPDREEVTNWIRWAQQSRKLAAA